MKSLWRKWNSINLVVRIFLGIVVGLVLALTIPDQVGFVSLFGALFVNALKAIAPILVFVLVINALSSQKEGQSANMKVVVFLYAFGTLSAGVIAVIVSFIFPTTITLQDSAQDVSPPSGVLEVLESLLFKIVSNPVTAIMEANYIGILAWAILLGITLKGANEATKSVISSLSNAISKIVEWVIALAPFGILGLVYDSINTSGLTVLGEYRDLLIVLLGTMFFIALILNPLIYWVFARTNPYPIVLKTLRESGVTAFFTRSSAANIPVNMKLCERFGLNRDLYSVAIPLGSTVNMAGAAVTISVLTLAAANTLNIEVDIWTAIILMVVAAVSASGASGVAGGSLLLIPVAASLLGIPNDIAMQVVAIGFVIGVVQDSVETALNSSTDVVFCAAADAYEKRKAN